MSLGSAGDGRQRAAGAAPSVRPAVLIPVPMPLHWNHLGVTGVALESAGSPVI